MARKTAFGYQTRVKRLNGKFGLIGNRNYNYGKWILEPKYDEIDITDGLVVTTIRKNGKKIYGLRDEDGRVIIDDNEYEYIKVLDTSTYEKLVLVKKDGKSGLVNRFGEVILDSEYEYIQRLETFDGYRRKPGILLKKDGNFGLADEYGKIQLPCKYEEIKIYTDRKYRDWWLVKERGKWGIFDRFFKEKISPRYKELAEYYNGCVIGKTEESNQWGLYRITKLTPDFTFDEFEFKDDDLAIKNNNYWGILAWNYRDAFIQIAQCEYDSIQTDIEGFIVEKKGKFGLINRNGTVLVPVAYDRYERNHHLTISFYIGETEITFSGEKGKEIELQEKEKEKRIEANIRSRRENDWFAMP